MLTCVLLVGGSPEKSCSETIRQAAEGTTAIVAIDRGLDALRDAGLSCDVFCGDADSVSEAGASLVRCAETSRGSAAHFDVVRYDPHKDATDLELALSEVSRRWPGAALRATCMSGGAPDHALAVLGRMAAWTGSIEVIEDAFEQRILKSGETWRLAGHVHERFTFIPLSAEACVSERGMRWELNRARVPLLSDLGVSNVVDEAQAAITCHDGVISAWVFKGFFAGA